VKRADMEKRNQLDVFEEFLLDEVNEHKMYPSDRVWNNIRTEVHGKRSWPALTIIALSVLSALTISTFIGTQKTVPLTFANQTTNIKVSPTSATKLYIANPTFNTSLHKKIANTSTNKLSKYALIESKQSTVETNSQNFTNSAVTLDSTAWVVAITTMPTIPTIVSTVKKPANLLPAIIREQVNSTIADIAPIMPLQKKKYSVQFYATPSASFRILSDQKVKELIQPSLIAIPLASQGMQTATFNQAVRHRPAVGLEIGFAFSYPLTKKLQFKTGLQLNIRQYQIDTYESNANAATLSLLNGGRLQTVSVMSSYNNNAGFKTAQLDNKVYQIALPMGLDYELLSFKKFSIQAQTSIQPTYNINKNVYLLSTDYANYAAGNDYVRKWNINTSVGLQFSYQKGNTRWQLGPQIRYQSLPTYVNPYPIKENLIDYGFRIGWSKQFK